MLKASPRLRKEAARIDCEYTHIIMADLILSGYTENEAYEIAYPADCALSAKMQVANRERTFASDGYQRAYEDRRSARRFNTETVESRDKDAVETEINKLINLTTDAKTKADLLMKLADLKQMKKDTSTNEDDTVKFFLSLECTQCPLLSEYNDFIAKKNKGKNVADWEMGIRPDEMQSIIERAVPKLKGLQELAKL